VWSKIKAAVGRLWRPRRRRTDEHGFYDQRAASQHRSQQEIEQAPGGGLRVWVSRLSGIRLRAAIRGGLVPPDVEGEAGSPVAVESLPARGQPPEAPPAGPTLRR